MKIAVLGTGPMGQQVLAKLAELGHEVTIGTRDVDATMARTEPDTFGNPPYPKWRERHPDIAVTTLAEAAATAELVVNATNGAGSIEALETAGQQDLAGKVLVDIANPLDYSQGMPPSLLVSNPDSLGEEIQRKLPDTTDRQRWRTQGAAVVPDLAEPSDVPARSARSDLGDS